MASTCTYGTHILLLSICVLLFNWFQWLQFDDKFGYERIHLKRPASENVDAPLSKKMTQLPGCSQNMDEASKISGKLSLC